MASISDIPGYSPKNTLGQSEGPLGTSTKDLTQNFLKLLTAQLRNQDPMSPIDNANMTSQLAALNQVDGINRLNATVESLVTQMSAASFVNLSSSVGKVALTKSQETYYSGQPQTLAVRVSAPVSDSKLLIKDSLGKVVRTLDLGNLPSGITDLVWAGDQDDGSAAEAGKTYQLEFRAKGIADESWSSDRYVGAAVVAIGKEDGDITATLADGRRVRMDEIVKWLAI